MFVSVKMNNREFIILNMYTPYESRQNEVEYVNRLAFISSFISEHQGTSVCVVGDMNADISDKHSYFHKHMVRFCNDANLILSSKELLPADSFTYYSEA